MTLPMGIWWPNMGADYGYRKAAEAARRRAIAQSRAGNWGASVNLAPGAVNYVTAAQLAAAMAALIARKEPKPEPIENAGIRAGEIIAWRCWEWDAEANCLRSMFVGERWTPGQPMTAEAWEVEKDYGVHAWKEVEQAVKYAKEAAGYPVVLGKVEMWGTVVEHERGYRAEFAKPISFDLIFMSARRTATGSRKLQHIRRLYGVAS